MTRGSHGSPKKFNFFFFLWSLQTFGMDVATPMGPICFFFFYINIYIYIYIYIYI
jgi:hypothetical protein